jgi:hypothetical protein
MDIQHDLQPVLSFIVTQWTYNLLQANRYIFICFLQFHKFQFQAIYILNNCGSPLSNFWIDAHWILNSFKMQGASTYTQQPLRETKFHLVQSKILRKQV